MLWECLWGDGMFLCKLAPKTRLWEGGFSLVRISSLLWSHTVTPRGAAQIGNLKFQKCDKARTGSPWRQAAAWWPLMKWLLKEVGRLIPAAERRAGQRPRNAQPGGGRIAAASQPRARPKTDSLCNFSLSGRGVASFRAVRTFKAVWDKRYQCHFKSRRWLGVSESYLRSVFRRGAHNLRGSLLGDSYQVIPHSFPALELLTTLNTTTTLAPPPHHAVCFACPQCDEWVRNGAMEWREPGRL